MEMYSSCRSKAISIFVTSRAAFPSRGIEPLLQGAAKLRTYDGGVNDSYYPRYDASHWFSTCASRSGVVADLLPTARDARNLARQFPQFVTPGKTFIESRPFVRFPPSVRFCVAAFARKLAKALYYKEARPIFPKDGCLMAVWETNIELLKAGSYPTFDLLRHLPDEVPPIVRDKEVLHDQFSYKWTLMADNDGIQRFLIQVKMAVSFAVVIFGCPVPGKIENLISGSPDDERRAMMILQSSILDTVFSHADAPSKAHETH